MKGWVQLKGTPGGCRLSLCAHMNITPGESNWYETRDMRLLLKTNLALLVQTNKKKETLQLYFLCSHWVCMLEPGVMFRFMVQPSTEPVCNTSMPWSPAAHRCVCYHRLSWVITGYHSALGPRNSFNPPLAFPAHCTQGALICNQSIGHTPL